MTPTSKRKRQRWFNDSVFVPLNLPLSPFTNLPLFLIFFWLIFYGTPWKRDEKSHKSIFFSPLRPFWALYETQDLFYSLCLFSL